MNSQAGLIFLRACVEQGRAPDTGDLKLILRDFISLEEENEVLKETIQIDWEVIVDAIDDHDIKQAVIKLWNRANALLADTQELADEKS